MAWESDLEKKIAALTPEEVKSALNRHIDPKKLVVVAAGDFEAVSADANSQPPPPAASPDRRE
jgi:zinc protease